MAAIGVRLTEDHKDFVFFGITDDGVTTSAYVGIDGLHKLLGELRTRLLRIIRRYLESARTVETLRSMPEGYWFVIDLDARGGRPLTFATDEGMWGEYRYASSPEVRAAAESAAMRPGP